MTIISDYPTDVVHVAWWWSYPRWPPCHVVHVAWWWSYPSPPCHVGQVAWCWSYWSFRLWYPPNDPPINPPASSAEEVRPGKHPHAPRHKLAQSGAYRGHLAREAGARPTYLTTSYSHSVPHHSYSHSVPHHSYSHSAPHHRLLLQHIRVTWWGRRP